MLFSKVHNTHPQDLHSTLVLLKVVSVRQLILSNLDLHSTLVLLKGKYGFSTKHMNDNLHSTLVLLKVVSHIPLA